MFQLKALLLAGHPSRSQVSCYESASLFFLDLKANIFPRLLLSVTAHRSRWLLDTTIDFLRRQARRFLPSLPEARVSAAAPRTSQAERGLIFIPSLSILEVLLGQTRVYLEILVVAGLRVKGLGVAARDLWRRDEAFGSITDLARGGAHGEEVALFAVVTHP